MQLSKDLQDFLRLLERHRVRYLISGVRFEDAYPKRTVARFGELDVSMIDRRSLAANKRAVGRPRDRVDAQELER